MDMAWAAYLGSGKTGQVCVYGGSTLPKRSEEAEDHEQRPQEPAEPARPRETSRETQEEKLRKKGKKEVAEQKSSLKGLPAGKDINLRLDLEED